MKKYKVDFFPSKQLVISDDETYQKGDIVIVDTQFGLRNALVLECDLSNDEEKNLNGILTGRVIRKATNEDLLQVTKNAVNEKKYYTQIESILKDIDIPMSLLAVRIDLKQTSCVIFYTSDRMVDFRLLLRELNTNIPLKIRLENIGDARLYAKLKKGYGVCGLEMCCVKGLHQHVNVTKKSLKTQEIAFNPVANYGNCNKLKCCLSFEERMYEELNSELPKKGDTVTYDHSRYIVTNRHLIKRTVTLSKVNDNSQTCTVSVDDIIWQK